MGPVNAAPPDIKVGRRPQQVLALISVLLRQMSARCRAEGVQMEAPRGVRVGPV